MTATFQPDLSDDISKVRQLIGDTVVDPASKADVQDETITAYLVSLSVLRTAARLASDLAAKYAKMAVSFTVDDQRNDYSKIGQTYADLALRLTAEAAKEENAAGSSEGSMGMVIVTGIADCRGPLMDDCCVDYWPVRALRE